MDYITSYIIDLSSYYGLIKVSGSDSVRFLNGQITIDVADISTDTFKLAAYCNPKGRIRALFRIFKNDEAYFLQLPKALLKKTLLTLKKYAQFSKVTLEEVNEDHGSILGLIYPKSNLMSLQKCFALNDFVQVFKINLPEFDRVELIGNPKQLEQLRNHIETEIKCTSASIEIWQLCDIRQGLPEILAETEEQFLPHYLNLPALGAVNFNKGCYAGQEIIARMHYRGNIKRQMVKAEMMTSATELPTLGTEILLSQVCIKGTDKNKSQVLENKPESFDRFAIIVNACFNEKQKIELLLEAPID